MPVLNLELLHLNSALMLDHPALRSELLLWTFYEELRTKYYSQLTNCRWWMSYFDNRHCHFNVLHKGELMAILSVSALGNCITHLAYLLEGTKLQLQPCQPGCVPVPLASENAERCFMGAWKRICSSSEGSKLLKQEVHPPCSLAHLDCRTERASSVPSTGQRPKDSLSFKAEMMSPYS